MTQNKTIHMDDATDAQLLEYAKQNLSNVHPSTGREKLLALVASAVPDGRITISDEVKEPVEPHPTLKTKPGYHKNGELLVTLQLSAPADDDNPQPAQVGVNGRNYIIQYGKPVDVPYSVYEVLNNAITTSTSQDKAGNLIENSRHTYAFNLMAPSMAEIREYLQTSKENQAA